MSHTLTIGTRGSRLALTQTNMVARMIEAANPGLTVDVHTLKTKGDRVTDAPLSSFGGEGVFVKELERALLAGEIDMAVHSLKDLPTTLPEGLAVAATPERADVRDALIADKADGLAALPEGACVATSSPRRRAQLLAHRPDLKLVDIRGNIDTRLKKLAETDDLDAIVLASAGLDRMDWGDRITERIACEICMPAVSQGALAIETRRDDERTIAAVARINHIPTQQAVLAERAFLRSMGGGCHTPIGAWGRIQDGTLHVDGVLAAPDGSRLVREAVSGAPEDAEASGRELADMIRRVAPQDILPSEHS